MKDHILTIAILFLTPLTALAESGPLGFGQAHTDSPMETDRPDFSEGTKTITPGHLQFEAGYLFEHDEASSGDTKQHTAPQLLTRIGVLDDLELRIVWDGYVHKEVDALTSEGSSDIALGFKHAIYEQGPTNPSVSFLFEISLPSGSAQLGSGDVEPEVKLLLAYDVGDAFSVASNINFAAPVADSDERFFETSASLAISTALSEELGAYFEYFGFYPNSDADDSSSTHFLNGGFTYALSENLQLDTLIGFGLTSESTDLFAGAGASYRI